MPVPLLAAPLIAGLIGGLLTFLASAVGRVLLALGLGYVVYSGLDLSINWLEQTIKDNFAGMPSDILQFLAWLWIDKAISMMFSAYAVAMAFKLAGSTVLRRMVQK